MASLLKLGSRGYHATVKEFNGQIRFHIRKYIDLEGLKTIPTKYGVALTIEEFQELKTAMDDLNEMLEVLIETSSMTTQPGDKSGYLVDVEQSSSQSNETSQQTPKNCNTSQVNEPPRKKLNMNNDGKVYFIR